MINGKTVSLCMVVYNSSDLCEKAIKSVQSICDEIVIVDQGSLASESEKLKSLASNYIKTTNKGNADFDRQYCYALATKDYILALDADEYFEEEQLNKIQNIFKYDFEINWFIFKNLVYTNTEKGEVEVNIKDILGDDPHPRLWKREINHQGKPAMPLMWPHEAHQFPAMISDKQIFSDIYVTHRRCLSNIIKTHLKRGQVISPEMQHLEKNFVRTLLQKFDFQVKSDLNKQFPELKNYLKG